MAAFPDLNFLLCYTWRRWNEKSELLLGFVRVTAITEAKKDPVRGPGLLNTHGHAKCPYAFVGSSQCACAL